MLDRLTNLIVIFVTVVAAVIAVNELNTAWGNTQSWEKEWVVKADAHPTYPSEKLLTAMKNATADQAYADASALQTELEKSYEPTGKILLRFSRHEIIETAKAFLFALLLLIVPLSFNYVRHGGFRLWNAGTQPGVQADRP